MPIGGDDRRDFAQNRADSSQRRHISGKGARIEGTRPFPGTAPSPNGFSPESGKAPLRNPLAPAPARPDYRPKERETTPRDGIETRQPAQSRPLCRIPHQGMAAFCRGLERHRRPACRCDRGRRGLLRHVRRLSRHGRHHRDLEHLCRPGGHPVLPVRNSRRHAQRRLRCASDAIDRASVGQTRHARLGDGDFPRRCLLLGP